MSPEERFREMFEATYPVVVRYARHRGLAGQDLEDLLSATFEVAWRRFDRVPAGEGAVPWLLTVAHNHLRNHRRRLARERGMLERLAAPEPVWDSSPSRVSWQEIRRALDRLSDSERELILLIAWDELTPAQAAGVLGLSAGATRTRLHRARAKLTDSLSGGSARGRTSVPRALADGIAAMRRPGA